SSIAEPPSSIAISRSAAGQASGSLAVPIRSPPDTTKTGDPKDCLVEQSRDSNALRRRCRSTARILNARFAAPSMFNIGTGPMKFGLFWKGGKIFPPFGTILEIQLYAQLRRDRLLQCHAARVGQIFRQQPGGVVGLEKSPISRVMAIEDIVHHAEQLPIAAQHIRGVQIHDPIGG